MTLRKENDSFVNLKSSIYAGFEYYFLSYKIHVQYMKRMNSWTISGQIQF